MIAQPELHHLLALPVPEKLRLAQRLIESALNESSANESPSVEGETTANSVPVVRNATPEPPANALISLIGIYHGGDGNTAERADEICLQEVDPYSGFTTKPRLRRP